VETKGPGFQNTYMVQEWKDGKEVERLAIQDHLVTSAMGGVLPEQENPTLGSVLDIACGPGLWLMELAQAYPIVEGRGIDASASVIEYARTQSQLAGLSDRLNFHVMDATLLLEFPARTFDLVNLRFGQSFLRTWEWPKTINEMLRVARPQGTIRVVECYLVPTSSSEALTEVYMHLVRAFHASGRLKEVTPAGMAHELAPLLQRYGVKDVQSKTIETVYQQGTEAGEAYYRDVSHMLQTLRPFLHKFATSGKAFDDLGRQALQDIQQSGFEATMPMVVTWGKASRF
jgi:ubiquinone/menaquinone biosynthesis C-methylase UbiE